MGFGSPYGLQAQNPRSKVSTTYSTMELLLTLGFVHIVYLECQAKHQAAARSGTAHVLNFVNLEWFNDPNTTIEEKYRDGFP